ncbi:MAG: DUF3795 domain-containing protein [archaeon]|jgi:hypothetical protein
MKKIDGFDMSEVFSPCGIHCNSCPWYIGEMDQECPGCQAVEGNPFWGSCDTYFCVREQDVSHCGECNDFPCREFMTRYDPREGPSNALMRAGLLAYRGKYGDREALELLEKAETFEPE